MPGRGFAQAKKILGTDYAVWLVHGGLRICYKFLKATHQRCLFHLLHRCQKMAEPSPRTSGFPLAVKQVLGQALALRDRCREKKISLHGMRTATGRLEAKLDHWLACRHWNRANQRLAKHPGHKRPYLFTFLCCPGLEATNNLAERVISVRLDRRFAAIDRAETVGSDSGAGGGSRIWVGRGGASCADTSTQAGVRSTEA